MNETILKELNRSLNLIKCSYQKGIQDPCRHLIWKTLLSTIVAKLSISDVCESPGYTSVNQR